MTKRWLRFRVKQWLRAWLLKHEHNPTIRCTPPGVHSFWCERVGGWVPFCRRDELITRQSIYGLSLEEAEWDKESWRG